MWYPKVRPRRHGGSEWRYLVLANRRTFLNNTKLVTCRFQSCAYTWYNLKLPIWFIIVVNTENLKFCKMSCVFSVYAQTTLRWYFVNFFDFKYLVFHFWVKQNWSEIHKIYFNLNSFKIKEEYDIKHTNPRYCYLIFHLLHQLL